MAQTKKVKTNQKTARFGMRIAPEKKTVYEATAKKWGYKSTSEWIEAMADWAIQYDAWDGNYEDYLKSVENGGV